MMESTYEQHVLEHGPSCAGREFCPEVEWQCALKMLSSCCFKSQKTEVLLPDS